MSTTHTAASVLATMGKPRSYPYESILAATKDRKGTVLYLVSWADCPLEEASFEPASCFGQEKAYGFAFEVLFLRKLFKNNSYKFLSNELCKSASGWKRGPAAPQMKNPQNIDALTHFEFSYQGFTKVDFKVCNPQAWPFGFRGSLEWQVTTCIPNHRRFRVSVEEAEEKAWRRLSGSRFRLGFDGQVITCIPNHRRFRGSEKEGGVRVSLIRGY